MTAEAAPTPGKPAWLRGLFAALVLLGCLVVAVVAGGLFFSPAAHKAEPHRFPHKVGEGGQLTLWWDGLPAGVKARTFPSGEGSNIRPSDYVGPAACQKCHPANYESWSDHPHRWMNALATAEAVKGDFTGKAGIAYRGGRASFYRRGDAYFMHLERGATRRTYRIHQTIGSRFFQYYVGKQVEGPEPRDHHFYTRDHLLPFGYWLSQKEWVPVVHIGPEVPDAQRADPFAPPDHGMYYADYAVSCNTCHTTFPLGDQFARRTLQMGRHAPVGLHFSLQDYLAETHPDLAAVDPGGLALPAPAVAVSNSRGFPGTAVGPGGSGRRVPAEVMAAWEAPRHAVTLGVSCEACHLGAREHVDSGGRVLPRFFPATPHLVVEAKDGTPAPGRTHANLNWACGRCHTGIRPRYAAGMSTWNSVEYLDAVQGACYSQLRCVDCHNPHVAIGTRWSRTADQDDARCLKCHDKFRPAPQRLAHTHHPAGSEGARCMNCHMPRLNEGLEDMVRTHMITSPTRADMIEAGQPNACNLCHTDRSIAWTLDALKKWYGKSYDPARVASYYPDARSAALGWLKNDDPAVRLAAGAALTRRKDWKALPALLDALDDPYLVNRQFTARGLQEMLGVRLSDFGYHFYGTADERRGPLAAVRARFAATARAP